MNKKYSFSAYEWYEDKENIYEVIFVCSDRPPHGEFNDEGEYIIKASVAKLRTCTEDPSDIEKYIFFYELKNGKPYVYKWRWIFYKD